MILGKTQTHPYLPPKREDKAEERLETLGIRKKK